MDIAIGQIPRSIERISSCLTFGHFTFFERPLGSLRATYHLRLIGKRVVNFLFVLIELFLLGVTAGRYERILMGNRR